jgi:hypothetical protein
MGIKAQESQKGVVEFKRFFVYLTFIEKHQRLRKSSFRKYLNLIKN